MNKLRFIFLLFLLIGVLGVQSVAPLVGIALTDQQTYSLAEEATGDEDSDERKELDKALNKSLRSNSNHRSVLLHFTEYFLNFYPVICEVVYPPPRS
ncbi:MAG: hypothetical protein ACO263_00065 [Cyclobacteriaceae bacterium]